MPPKEPRRGDLFWLDGASPSGVAHPHVVVQDDLFNRSRVATVIVCALTTNLERGAKPGNVTLRAGEGGLPKASVIVVSQVSSVDRARLVDHIGTLDEERVDQALAGLRFQQA